jgi:hypothetical protein
MTSLRTARRGGLAALISVTALCLLSPAVQAQTPSPPSGVILGRVVEAATDRGVAGAVVRLTAGAVTLPAAAAPGSRLAAAQAGVAAVPDVITNGSGHFLFRDVPAGRYSITVKAAGFLPAAYGQRRHDGPPRTLEVDASRPPATATIRAWRPGVIAGTLRDERGDPVIGAPVRAMRSEWRPTGAGLVPTAATTTDDRGHYRLAPLPPGGYVVLAPSTTTSVPRSIVDQLLDAYRSISNSGAISADMPQVLWNMRVSSGTLVSPEGLDAGSSVIEVPVMPGRAGVIAPRLSPDGVVEVYRTTLHPSAATLASASVVDLSPGETRSGVDITLELTRAFRVSGRLSVADGPSSDQIVHLLPRESRALGGDPDLATATTISEADGRFALTGVPRGDYRLAVLRFGRPPSIPGEGKFADFNGRTLWADVPVSVTDRDVTDLVVPLADGVSVEGRLVFEGAAPDSAGLLKTTVGLVPVDREVHGMFGLATPPDPSGAFVTTRYPPGRYFITVSPPAGEWVVKSISVAGRSLAHDPIALVAADVRDVVVTLATRTAALSGSVRSTSSDFDVVVLLMPGDAERWIANGLPSSLSRRATPDEDGRFRIDRLIAGDYLIVAVDATLDLNLGDPAAVRALARAASAVTIGEGVDATVALSVSQVP